MPASPGFLDQILDVLGMTSRQLAKAIGVRHSEVEPFLGVPRHNVSPIDTDEVWIKLAEYLDNRIAEALAVRQQLQGKLTADRKRRAAARIRIEHR